MPKRWLVLTILASLSALVLLPSAAVLSAQGLTVQRTNSFRGWEDSFLPLFAVALFAGIGAAWVVRNHARRERHRADGHFVSRVRYRLLRGAGLAIAIAEAALLTWLVSSLLASGSVFWDPRAWLNIRHLLILSIFGISHVFVLYALNRWPRWSGSYAMGF